MNLNALDLNLLRVLDAMLRDRSTTRVGERIGLSQPAVSAALNRLRAVLKDPLFVREGNRMVPTPFAETIEEPLAQALGVIEGALSRTPFDPTRSTRTFRMLGDNFLADILLPPLVDRLHRDAPGMLLQLLPTNPRSASAQLAEGTIDIAFGPREQGQPEWIADVFTVHGRPVSVASRDNKQLADRGIKDGESIPLDLVCDMRHVKFAPEGDLVGAEDRALARLGRRRRIVLTVPDFFSVAQVVAESQLTGLMPEQLARSLAGKLGLTIHPSIRVKPISLYLSWHRRNSDDPEHRWMRECILELLMRTDPAGDPASPAPAGRAPARVRRPRPRNPVD